MFALAITAAALLLDPTVKTKSEPQPPRPKVEAVSQSASAPALSVIAVTVECTARANGQVENCQVLGETHPGLGFGEAAIALMRDARVPPGPSDVQFARTIQFTP
jgi:TonB family protein